LIHWPFEVDRTKNSTLLSIILIILLNRLSLASNLQSISFHCAHN
uniref:Uncharacterized protein n=1 Tax=Anopheles atroparvus TaxID=41427 RepID=A0AAG5DF66_ANOAO